MGIRAPAPPKNPRPPEQYLRPRAPKESSSLFKNEVIFSDTVRGEGASLAARGRESPLVWPTYYLFSVGIRPNTPFSWARSFGYQTTRGLLWMRRMVCMLHKTTILPRQTRTHDENQPRRNVHDTSANIPPFKDQSPRSSP